MELSEVGLFSGDRGLARVFSGDLATPTIVQLDQLDANGTPLNEAVDQLAQSKEALGQSAFDRAFPGYTNLPDVVPPTK